MLRLVTGLFAVALFSTATAAIHSGNPKLDIIFAPPEGTLTGGEATVDTVRVYTCGGGFIDYTLDEDIDPALGFDLSISGGDLCGVTVYWTGDVILEGINSVGNYTLHYSEPSSHISLEPVLQQAPLIPFLVTEGTISSSNPLLDLQISPQ